MQLSARMPNPGTQDLVEGFRRWRDWLALGWADFTYRHRRTIIGPLWQTVQVAVWVLGLTLVFRRTEGGDINYVAYVALGVTFWNFMSSIITSSAGVFTRNANLILNLQNPLSLYIFRGITESLSALIFQFLVCVFILATAFETLTKASLMFIPGLLALIFTAFWVAPLLAIIGSRFHDARHLLTVVMRFLFFASPIFWVVRDSHGPRKIIAAWNPFTHYLDIVRTPLLGQMPSTLSWTIVGCISVSGCLISFLLFRRYRQKIIFWI